MTVVGLTWEDESRVGDDFMKLDVVVERNVEVENRLS